MATTSISVVQKGIQKVVHAVADLANPPRWLGLGTGSNAVTQEDESLQTPRPEARINCDMNIVEREFEDDTMELVGEFTAGSNAPLTEAGLFDASSGGDLFLRCVFDVITLAEEEGIQLTFHVQYVPIGYWAS